MMYRFFSTACLGIVCLLAVSACATSQPSRFYGLIEVRQTDQYTGIDQKLVSIGPVRIAEYLDRPNIVTRVGEAEFRLAEYDRWTEPLDKSIQRTITNDVAAILGSNRVLEYPAGSQFDAGYIIPAMVSRFDTDEHGNATLEIQWTIRDVQGGNKVQPRRSRYVTSVGSSGDMGAIVTALSQLLGDFSQDLADVISQRP